MLVAKQYGLYVEKASDTALYINEAKALGGFDAVYSDDGTMGSSSSVTVSTTYGSNNGSPNYNQSYCYSRMPNPGMYSGMYDSAINLSGRKYWYRQEGRIYLYKEDFLPEILQGDSDSEAQDREAYLMVWLLARSRDIAWTQNFPIPADMEAEIIKSLVATFTMMRAAKEDNINDNVDAT